MKIISLNTWGGQAFDELVKFVSSHAEDTDVFCFQEVFDANSDMKETNGARANLFNDISSILTNFTGHRAFVEVGFDYAGPVSFHLGFGLATFVRNSLTLVSQENIIVHGSANELSGHFGEHPRNVHVLKIKYDDSDPIIVVNFHGLWRKGFGKGDFDERIIQSNKVREVMARYSEPKVLIGDFNLLPDTQSLNILKEGKRDLISEFGITSTRSDLYDKPGSLFADYAIISPEIEVESFEVPRVNASDHLPLILKIKI